ncbi:hypothetical protein EV360DRAFT_71965 [Lentinula raphanica]|nr:hypothetical protein EV360DRAFT_71965 [Lentinula raphanica]
MRLNTGFVFCALVCLSTILHPACGSPVPPSNGMRMSSLSSETASGSNADPETEAQSWTVRVFGIIQRDSSDPPVEVHRDVNFDFLKSCLVEGLTPYATSKLGIDNPIIDTNNFHDRGELPTPLRNSPRLDFAGFASLTIVYDVHTSEPLADRSSIRMVSWKVPFPPGDTPDDITHEIVNQMPHVDDILRIGPGISDLRFTNPDPFDRLKRQRLQIMAVLIITNVVVEWFCGGKESVGGREREMPRLRVYMFGSTSFWVQRYCSYCFSRFVLDIHLENSSHHMHHIFTVGYNGSMINGLPSNQQVDNEYTKQRSNLEGSIQAASVGTNYHALFLFLGLTLYPTSTPVPPLSI